MSKYPAIPDFYGASDMELTVRALKDVVEQLAGLRSGQSQGAPTVFVQQAPPSTLLDPTNKAGDFWIQPGPPPALWYWSGTAWVQVAP